MHRNHGKRGGLSVPIVPGIASGFQTMRDFGDSWLRGLGMGCWTFLSPACTGSSPAAGAVTKSSHLGSVSEQVQPNTLHWVVELVVLPPGCICGVGTGCGVRVSWPLWREDLPFHLWALQCWDRADWQVWTPIFCFLTWNQDLKTVFFKKKITTKQT